jgi:hypothetical protein
MLTIFVLDVPEFRPLVDAAKMIASCVVTDSKAGYWRIDSDTPVSFNRKEMGIKPAVWYGAFTGGIKGDIIKFEQNVVTLAPRQVK